MSTNFKELSEFIKLASNCGVEEFSIEGEKVSVKFKSIKPQNIDEPVPQELQGPVQISSDLAKKIQEIHDQEEALNKMIADPEAYEEELANLDEHEIEDMPAAGEGEE